MAKLPLLSTGPLICVPDFEDEELLQVVKSPCNAQSFAFPAQRLIRLPMRRPHSSVIPTPASLFLCLMKPLVSLAGASPSLPTLFICFVYLMRKQHKSIPSNLDFRNYGNSGNERTAKALIGELFN